jgi:hypothetical protein
LFGLRGFAQAKRRTMVRQKKTLHLSRVAMQRLRGERLPAEAGA